MSEYKETSLDLKIFTCVVKNSHNARLQTEHKLKKACAKEHGFLWSVLKPWYVFHHQVKGNKLISALLPKTKKLVIPGIESRSTYEVTP